ncbi:T3SS regulon translocated regulator ExsE family protein [Aeromonas dhakensis]|uniref:T3SS regulon translocated regulator ExsE family protein n=1 Tax=Aeromonas dhakensis TaxID=196024 RepID=UPI00208F3006|nr:T3SS regulon translocated regulator ExsE family protein [Aeromonas dhakensis]USP11700.1 T3SS regulon translocated regulator ExsE family protein [Aeromonas dhakensis]
MKIQEQQVTALSQGAARSQDGNFAGWGMHIVSIGSDPQPLAVQLRASIHLDQTQEVALQRLQQGEHLPLSERRIRVV